MRDDAAHDPAEGDADQRDRLAGLGMDLLDPCDQLLAIWADGAHAEIAAELPGIGSIAEPAQHRAQHEVRAIGVAQAGRDQHRPAIAARQAGEPEAGQLGQRDRGARGLERESQPGRRFGSGPRDHSHSITPQGSGVQTPIGTPALRRPRPVHSLQVLKAL
jgi:hypothetical protein